MFSEKKNSKCKVLNMNSHKFLGTYQLKCGRWLCLKVLTNFTTFCANAKPNHTLALNLICPSNGTVLSKDENINRLYPDFLKPSLMRVT